MITVDFSKSQLEYLPLDIGIATTVVCSGCPNLKELPLWPQVTKVYCNNCPLLKLSRCPQERIILNICKSKRIPLELGNEIFKYLNHEKYLKIIKRYDFTAYVEGP